jgi:hypothetical protein
MYLDKSKQKSLWRILIMADATFTNSVKENLGSVNMVRKVATGAAADIVITVATSKVLTFTAADFDLNTIVGGFATTLDTFPLSFMVTSTGCTVTTQGTANVLVSDEVAITAFGK